MPSARALPPGPGAGRGVHAVVVLVPVLVLLVLGFWGLDRGSMWQDEEATFEVSQRSLAQIWAMVHHIDVVHAVYYVFIHCWLQLSASFGAAASEVWIRVPSVLAVAACAGLIAALGRRLVGDRAGLLAGLSLGCLPFVSFYAQEARSFAMVAAFVLLATYCLVRAVQTPARRWWIGYLVAAAVAEILHEFAILALLAQAITLLVSRVPWRVWRPWAVCAVICGVLVAPLAVVSRHQSTQVAWLGPPDWSTVTDFGSALAGPTPVAVVVLVVSALVGLSVARPTAAGLSAESEAATEPTEPTEPMEQPGFRIAAVAVPLLLAPPLVLLLASLVQPLFVDRYVFYSAAAIPLLAGAGLDRLGRLLPRPWVGWLAGLLVVVVVFAAQWGPLRAVRTIDSRSDDLAGAARVVAAGARPGDGVVFMPTKYRAAALGYPKDFQEVHDLAMAETPIQASNLRGVDKSRRQTRAAMLSTQRIWVIGRPGLKVGSGEKGAVTERDTLTADFRKVQQVDVDGLEIALFVRR